MKHYIRASLCLLSLLLLLPGCAGRGETLHEEWSRVSMGGVRIGYVHTISRRSETPSPAIVTSIFSETRLSRFGMSLTLRTDVEYREDLEGRILTARSETHGPGANITAEAKVLDGEAELITRTMGVPRKQVIPWDDRITGPWAQAKRIRESGLKPGASITMTTFVPDLARVTSSTLTVEAPETLTLDGQTMDLMRGTMSQDILPGMKTMVWLDAEGNVVRSLTDVMGGIETMRTTRDDAMRGIAPKEVADVMDRFMIRSNRTLAEPGKARDLVFLLKGTPDMFEGFELEDRRQAVLERTPDGVRLRVRSMGDAAAASAERPGNEFMAPSAYMQSDDALIVSIARRATKGAKTPLAKAERLNAWVHENITEKNFSVSFATAKETALSHAGDCTEHAVLLAALLRAEGIPARVVVGLVYWKGLFGYHMWTEAFLNDWTAFDPTFDQSLVDATHIKLTSSALESAGATGPFLSLLQVIGKIQVDIEEADGGTPATGNEK